jgi:hypothetical protein
LVREAAAAARRLRAAMALGSWLRGIFYFGSVGFIGFLKGGTIFFFFPPLPRLRFPEKEKMGQMAQMRCLLHKMV